MQWHERATLNLPDGLGWGEFRTKVDTLVIVAHQDDIDIMAPNEINRLKKAGNGAYLLGVVINDGAGSPTAGPTAGMTADEISKMRAQEQLDAAELGNYGVFQLMHPKSALVSGKGVSETTSYNGPDSKFEDLVQQIQGIIMQTRPKKLYLHNPLDRHTTHNATTAATFEALRRLPPDFPLPEEIIGGEVWRGLNWVPTEENYELSHKLLKRIPISEEDRDLFVNLIKCHASQNHGSKSYEIEIPARWRLNVTMADSHQATIGKPQMVSLNLDLKPFVELMRSDSKMTVEQYFNQVIEEAMQALQLSAKRSSPPPNATPAASVERAFDLPPELTRVSK